MNDKAAGLPHLTVVQRMLEVVILKIRAVCLELNAMYGLGVETVCTEYAHNLYISISVLHALG